LGGHPSDQKNDDESCAPVANEYAATPFGPRCLIFRTIEFAWIGHAHLGSPSLDDFNFVRLPKKAAVERRRTLRRVRLSSPVKCKGDISVGFKRKSTLRQGLRRCVNELISSIKFIWSALESSALEPRIPDEAAPGEDARSEIPGGDLASESDE